MATPTTPSFSPEFARTAAEVTLGSIEYEKATTRKVIKAITKPEFRLDPKGRTALEAAWHIVYAEAAFLKAIAAMDFSGMQEDPAPPATIDEIVAWYDQHLPKAIAAVRAMTPQQLATPLNFANVFNFPAFIYLDFAIKHSVHHRGQLSAYLRPMGSKVPQIYGGSADEPWTAAA